MSDRAADDSDDAAAAARAFLSTISMDAPAAPLTRPQRSPSAPDTPAAPPPQLLRTTAAAPAPLQRPRSPSAPDAHASARSFLTSIELTPAAPCALPTTAPPRTAPPSAGVHVRRPPSVGLGSCLPHRHPHSQHSHGHGHGHTASRLLLFGGGRRTQSSHEHAPRGGTPPTAQDPGQQQELPQEPPEQQQQQQQQGHVLCGYSGVAEVCSQSRRRQRHVRLVFASGAACPLIAASYRLDRRVHISDFGPYDVQLPVRGRRPAVRAPVLRPHLPPWLPRAGSPDASLTVSDTASSLSDSPQAARRSFAACLVPRWVGSGTGTGDAEAAVLDPWNENEHHATVVALTGLRASVVPYLGARAARDEADARFLREHPVLRDTGLRVTKLRKRKMTLLQLTVSTVCVTTAVFLKQ